MKIKFLSMMLVAAAMASCTGNKNASDTDSANIADEQNTVASVDLNGQWQLENIAVNDSVSVTPDSEQYVTFNDSTYSFTTNCNTISGPYTLKGDSIVLGEGPATLMACENMQTEEALRQILPVITTVSVENDSTVKLNGSSQSEFILLRKAAK